MLYAVLHGFIKIKTSFRKSVFLSQAARLFGSFGRAKEQVFEWRQVSGALEGRGRLGWSVFLVPECAETVLAEVLGSVGADAQRRAQLYPHRFQVLC